jgi:sortase A
MNRKKIIRFSAILSGVFGIIIILIILIPLFKYRADSNQKFPDLLSPEGNKSTTKVLGAQVVDLTKASNWFVGGATSSDFASREVQFYTLSIPKLKIDTATVSIGGEDLSKYLIQYPGTSLPGRPGNAVIFGHSVLPVFFNPDSYNTIFSTIPTLKIGDQIEVVYDGIVYLYKVENMFEVLPTDIQVLEQNYSNSFITLVTCVPPGDPRKSKRLIVRARIVAPEEKNANIRY